jgi:hypothetical protein
MNCWLNKSYKVCNIHRDYNRVFVMVYFEDGNVLQSWFQDGMLHTRMVVGWEATSDFDFQIKEYQYSKTEEIAHEECVVG